MTKKFVIPKSKHTAINKFLSSAENVLLRRVYALNAGGTYSADNCMHYLINYIERLGNLKDRGKGFEDDRQAAISLIWDMVGEVQNQGINSPAWQDPRHPEFIEDSATLKQVLGLTPGAVFEAETNNRDAGYGCSDKTDRWLKNRFSQVYGNAWEDDQ